MDLYSASSLTQKSAGRIVAPLGHINILDTTLCNVKFSVT